MQSIYNYTLSHLLISLQIPPFDIIQDPIYDLEGKQEYHDNTNSFPCIELPSRAFTTFQPQKLCHWLHLFIIGVPYFFFN